MSHNCSSKKAVTLNFQIAYGACWGQGGRGEKNIYILYIISVFILKIPNKFIEQILLFLFNITAYSITSFIFLPQPNK